MAWFAVVLEVSLAKFLETAVTRVCCLMLPHHHREDVKVENGFVRLKCWVDAFEETMLSENC